MKGKFSSALSLALIAAMLVTVLAFADNLNNDAVSSGLNTITAGGSTTITYQLVGNKSPSGDPNGCDATSANPVTVTITKHAAVSGLTSFSFTDCGPSNSVQVTFSSNTSGSYDITHSVSGGVSGSKFNNNADFTLTVNPVTPTNTPPTLTLPGDITAEATNGDGAVVTFVVTASDAEDDPDPTPSCSPASGSTFPLGTTQVDCSVTDSNGATSSGMFNVTVQDTTPPVVTVPADITAEATGPSGAVVTFSASATDIVDGAVATTCAPASGSTFALGTTSVTCSATDAAGNTGSASFNITVQDTTPPAVIVPADITAEATGPSGAVVTFSASSSDIVDGALTPTCVPASGSTFALGTTSVTCSATDAHGNTGSASFNVTVEDTTPPTLTVPADMIVPATSPAGAVVTFSATATDLVDPSPVVTCVPPSGSTFAPGKTTVSCTAADFSGNASSPETFQVWVTYQLKGFYQPVDMNGVFNVVKGGSTVPLKFEVFAGATELTATSEIKPFVVTRIACDGSSATDEIEFTTTGGTSLRYDAVAGQFIQNWQTPKLPGACYRVTMTTLDGSSLVAFFKLK